MGEIAQTRATAAEATEVLRFDLMIALSTGCFGLPDQRATGRARSAVLSVTKKSTSELS